MKGLDIMNNQEPMGYTPFNEFIKNTDGIGKDNSVKVRFLMSVEKDINDMKARAKRIREKHDRLGKI